MVEQGRPTAEEAPNSRVTVGPTDREAKFAGAAVENEKLATEIEWAFGGRL